MIKFAHTVIMVENIAKTKIFYSDVLGIKLIKDHGVFLHYERDLAFHQSREFIQTVFKGSKSAMPEKGTIDNVDIYFESDDLESVVKKLQEENVVFIHGIEKQAWGQNVFRFFDPDGYIVEIGEPAFVEF